MSQTDQNFLVVQNSTQEAAAEKEIRNNSGELTIKGSKTVQNILIYIMYLET